jgi:ABC-type multidrug transport system permease subunit
MKELQMKKIRSEDLDVLLKFIVGVILAMTLAGIIFTVLYSLIFVTQPIGFQSPNDAEFFKLISPIATFLTGALSGIMLTKKDAHSDDEESNNKKKGN